MCGSCNARATQTGSQTAAHERPSRTFSTSARPCGRQVTHEPGAPETAIAVTPALGLGKRLAVQHVNSELSCSYES